MASIIVTNPPLDVGPNAGDTFLDDPDFTPKLAVGMRDFGLLFRDLYAGSVRDPAALLQAFEEMQTSIAHSVYAISPTPLGPEIRELLKPRFNEDETVIVFNIVGLARRFRLHIREDRKYQMNVSMPIFDNALAYLTDVATFIKGTTFDADQSAQFLLANSLISRCK